MHQKATPSLGAYLPGKLRQAADDSARLMDMINRLTQIAYEKGTRKGDIAIREKLKGVVGEVEEQYRALRLFASGKSGEIDAFRELLDFFDRRFLDHSVVGARLDALKDEIAGQEKLDQDHNTRHAAEGYVRKVNRYVKDLERDLAEWEKYFLYHAEPKLRRVLHDINEIVLYYGIDSGFRRLITNDDVFSRSGTAYADFKKGLARYARTYIKLARAPMPDADIRELINRILQQMGFRNPIMRTRNINQEKYNEILTEIITEGRLAEYAENYAGMSGGALDAIREHEKQREGRLPDVKDVFRVLEDLCNLDDAVKPVRADTAKGLARNESGRFLFHVPGASEYTLKTVSEYLRDSHIFVVDWMYRELQKTPSLSRLMEPLLALLPAIQEFIGRYVNALETASEKTNQAAASLLSGEKHYISKEIAGDLIESIRRNCDGVKSALIELSYNAGSSSYNRSGVLSKKIDILKDSCSSSCAKIGKGISEMDRK